MNREKSVPSVSMAYTRNGGSTRANELGMLKANVKKFSHWLRGFRNYIHPYEQMVSGFMPDEHTAKVCFQVLKAALASVAGERP